MKSTASKVKRITLPIEAINKIQDDIECAIDNATAFFVDKMDKLAFDERDVYPDFEGLVRKHLGYVPFTNDMHKNCKNQANAWIEAARDLAYQRRVGTRISIARAADKLDKYSIEY